MLKNNDNTKYLCYTIVDIKEVVYEETTCIGTCYDVISRMLTTKERYNIYGYT